MSGLPPHRVIGSVGETDFRVGDDGPELVKSAAVQVLDDGPQKPSSIHRHVGQRPIMAGGNTDGDLAMLQWSQPAQAGPCSSSSTTPMATGSTPTTATPSWAAVRTNPRRRHRAQVDRDRHGRRLGHHPPPDLLAERVVIPGGEW